MTTPTPPLTLAFDIYGTLIDTNGVLTALSALVDQPAAFAQTWRDKQLEYSFRRGLMQCYENFAVCTAQALDYTCAYTGAALSAEDKQALLRLYRELPAFADVAEGLQPLQQDGYDLVAFSNGSRTAVNTLLSQAGLQGYFSAIISADDIGTFKPNPAVYQHCLQQTRSRAADTWLVSSNPFDVIGAIHTGMKAAWVKRSATAVFDPWGIAPTLTLQSLPELSVQLKAL